MYCLGPCRVKISSGRFFFSLSKPHRVQHQIYCLLSGHLVGYNTIVVEIPDYNLEHDQHRILLPVTIYDRILYLCPRICPVDRRKSRSSSFSIRNRVFLYVYSDNVFAGFRPRDFGIPCRSFLRSCFSNPCTSLYPLNPNVSSTCFCVIPFASISLICGNNSCVCW